MASTIINGLNKLSVREDDGHLLLNVYDETESDEIDNDDLIKILNYQELEEKFQIFKYYPKFIHNGEISTPKLKSLIVNKPIYSKANSHVRELKQLKKQQKKERKELRNEIKHERRQDKIDRLKDKADKLDGKFQQRQDRIDRKIEKLEQRGAPNYILQPRHLSTARLHGPRHALVSDALGPIQPPTNILPPRHIQGPGQPHTNILPPRHLHQGPRRSQVPGPRPSQSHPQAAVLPPGQPAKHHDPQQADLDEDLTFRNPFDPNQATLVNTHHMSISSSEDYQKTRQNSVLSNNYNPYDSYEYRPKASDQSPPVSAIPRSSKRSNSLAYKFFNRVKKSSDAAPAFESLKTSASYDATKSNMTSTRSKMNNFMKFKLNSPKSRRLSEQIGTYIFPFTNLRSISKVFVSSESHLLFFFFFYFSFSYGGERFIDTPIIKWGRCPDDEGLGADTPAFLCMTSKRGVTATNLVREKPSLAHTRPVFFFCQWV